MANINDRPRFAGGNKSELKNWAVSTALPWLTENLGLTAGVICGSLGESLRRKVYGLDESDQLPQPIDWSKNGIIISPPGTGKGMAIFVEALAHYRKVYVLVPSVIQAHKLEESLDFLYDVDLGGCMTSQRKAKGEIVVITTGILHQLIRDKSSDLWKDDTILIVDEAQRVIDGDLLTQFMVGVAAHQKMRVMVVSATIAPGTLPRVYGHGEELAEVYELNKQMHPIEVKVISGDDFSEMYANCPAFTSQGETVLLFAPSRRQIMATVKMLNKSYDVVAIPVTGAHIVEEQIGAIKKAQATGRTVVVVGTPGTMDSSVTIPGLSIVGIIDNRLEIYWNKHAVKERQNKNLPINHIVQMMRRVGRVARTDGKKDQVYIFSNKNREDVLVENFQFDPLQGCSPYSPLEDLILEAVNLDISFAKIHDYMVSDFSDDRIEETVERLLVDGMIDHANNIDDPDGFVLTPKGDTVVALPYDYKWSKMIVDAPEDLRVYMVLGASFGRLADLEMFESDEGMQVDADATSQVIRKINLGIEYVNAMHDDAQRYMAGGADLSFRRMEQMEQLFMLGCDALEGMDCKARLVKPTGETRERLVREIVLGGLYIGLFDVFFAAKSSRGDYQDIRKTPDMSQGFRRFFIDADGLKLAKNEVGGIAVVVGEPQWFTSRAGNPLGNLDNVTIVPDELRGELVREYAEKNGWIKLTFESSISNRGRSEMVAKGADGIKYIASFVDNEPHEGVEYWCSVDRRLAYGVKTVFVQCPTEV